MVTPLKPTKSVIIVLPTVIIMKQHILRPRYSETMITRIANPFRLDPEENPYPSPNHLQEFHQENPTLEIGEMVQMRTQFQAPGTPEE